MKVEFTHDARFVLRKVSTWLSIAAASISASCGAALLAFSALPAQAQVTVDAGMLGVLSKCMMAAAAVSALVPVATSVAQQSIKKAREQ